jgi:Rod binding domain-containing protein
MTDPLPIQPTLTTPPGAKPQLTMRAAAEKLEATFLAEMLKSAGLGAQSHGFGGGIGEDQFASFQREALADAMVARGGIGLAEVFFNALKEKTGE